jgi:hypothetical protein
LQDKSFSYENKAICHCAIHFAIHFAIYLIASVGAADSCQAMLLLMLL